MSISTHMLMFISNFCVLSVYLKLSCLGLFRTHLFHVNFKRSGGLTLRAGAGLYFLVLRLVEWPEDEITLVTVILDDAELGHDSSRTRHHTACSD